MISSLQALRFIFALFIFFQHFPIRNEEPRALLDGAGYMGVSFFLVLSGFVMRKLKVPILNGEPLLRNASFAFGHYTSYA